jgi:hypothetical protein
MAITARVSARVPACISIIAAALIERAEPEIRDAFKEAAEELGEDFWEHPIILMALEAEAVHLGRSLWEHMLPFREYGCN